MAAALSLSTLSVGAHSIKAVYSGDANYHSSQSVIAEEPLCVFPACTTTFTLLSSTSIILGQSVTDQVVVSGLGGMFPVPSGTVDFQVQVGTGLWATYDTETLSVLGTDGVATSIAYMPLTVTSYNFRAIYNGDHNYLSSQSQNGESLSLSTPESAYPRSPPCSLRRPSPSATRSPTQRRSLEWA